MFVRTQGSLATVTCAVVGLGGGCTNDVVNSDLRDGPPDVLAIVVNSPDHRDPCSGSNQATCSFSPGQPLEQATFCKAGDTKRPGLVGTIDLTTVQVCPATLSAAATEITDAFYGIQANAQNPMGGLVTPTNGWYARIMFANLLQPNIEDLIPNIDPSTKMPDGTFTGTLATTQPVTLTCGGTAVQYDGYYSPSGNSLSYPVGPSLFIAPLDPTSVAGGTECSLSIKNTVKNKAGQAVPSSELGPYTFKVGQIALQSSTPNCAGNLPGCSMGDLTMPTMIDATAASLVLTFSGAVDVTSLTAADVVLQTGTDCMTPTATATAVIGSDSNSPAALDVFDAAATGTNTFVTGQTYIFTFKAGVMVKDVAGGDSLPMPAPADFTVCFTT
jgi:hypothetical protein